MASIAVLVLYPIIHLLLQSIQSNGKFNLIAYREVFTNKHTFIALWNTVKLQFLVLAFCWLFGGLMAFIRTKTNYKHRKRIDSFVFLSLIFPPFIFATSMKLLLGNNGFLERIFNILQWSYDIDIYTILGAAICLSMHMYPFVYYGIKNRLLLLDDDVIKSARTLGVKQRNVIFKVVLPMLMPAFLSTGLLVLARTMANYTVPAELLLPQGIEVLTTRIYSAQASLQLNVTSVLCIFMVILSTVIFIVSVILEKKSSAKSATVVSNKSEEVVKLSKTSNKILHVLVIIVFSCITIIPFIILLFASFFKRWGLKLFTGFGNVIRWDYLTLNNYKILFKEGMIWEPLLNSLIYGGIAAIISTIIATTTVYLYNYKPSRMSKLLINIAQLPIAIPNIILAMASMLAWRSAPFDFYGKPIIIIVTYIVLFTPICIKQILPVSQNLDKSVYDSAKTMGLSQFTIFKNIYLKQISNGVYAGFFMTFLIAFKEIPISLLLYTSDSKTLGVLLFIIQSNSYGLEMTSAVAVVVIVISLLINILLLRIRKGIKHYEQVRN